jgi:tetratricopeptide (TPR) repeat protein
LIDSFIKSYSNSPHRPDADRMLVSFWVSNKDNAKILNHADNFKQSLPSADNASKAFIYTQGMVAAYTLNNTKKTVEFGQYALTAEPNNFTVLAFLASSGAVDQKTAIEYANKASALPKPNTMADAQYQSLMGRVKNLLAGANGGAAPAAGGGNAVMASARALLEQKKYQEAIEIYQQALQQNPKEQTLHYQVAVANYYMMADAIQTVQAANDEQIKAMIATPVVQADVQKAATRKDEFTKITMDRRDAAIEALGKAIAVGGPLSADAKKMLDPLYQNKKGSLEGQDQFIAEKKKELGVTDAPAPAPKK